MDKRLENALALAGRGFRLFPQTIAKTPPSGFTGYIEKATNDPETLKEWAKAYPACNFAIVLQRSGLIAVDADLVNHKTGEALPGLESLAKLEEACGKLDTWRDRSPSGGVHLYFKAPAGVEKNVPEIPGYPGLEVLVNHAVTPAGMRGRGGSESVNLERFGEPAEVPASLLAILRNGKASAKSSYQKQRETQSTQVLKLADDLRFFNAGDVGYAVIDQGDHRENLSLHGSAFRKWLAYQFYLEKRSIPGSQALQDAINVLEGRAQFESPTLPIYTRVAGTDETIYLDICNPKWQAIEITAYGWQIVDDPPVRFRRTKGMAPLPYPVHGGKLIDVIQFLNAADTDDAILLISFLVTACRPHGPYPVLTLHGEQGSAKSTTARVIRSLIDPNTAMLRSSPKEIQDLAIAANNGWVINLDNLSHLPDWLSDGICRLSTGAGFATRQLYSDDEETIFQASRPVIMNGIEDLSTRGDLLDRSIVLYLPAVAEASRRSEADFWTAFQAAHPALLGSLLDSVAGAIKELPKVKIDRPPRMADFAEWACAAMPSIGTTGEAFLAVYRGNRLSGTDLVLDASPIWTELVRFMEERDKWSGSAKELLSLLAEIAGPEKAGSKTWPKDGTRLSGKLARIAPAARERGIRIDRGRGTKRFIEIEKIRMGRENSDGSDGSDGPTLFPVANDAIDAKKPTHSKKKGEQRI